MLHCGNKESLNNCSKYIEAQRICLHYNHGHNGCGDAVDPVEVDPVTNVINMILKAVEYDDDNTLRIVVGPVVLPGQDRPYSSERVNLPILFLAALVNVVVPPGGDPPTGGDTESYGWQKSVICLFVCTEDTKPPAVLDK